MLSNSGKNTANGAKDCDPLTAEGQQLIRRPSTPREFLKRPSKRESKNDPHAAKGASLYFAAFSARNVWTSSGAVVFEVTMPAYDKFLAIDNTISVCEFAVAAADLYHDAPSDN